VIQVRFVYENSLTGEWVNAADGAYLYPNPEFRGDVTAVQVRDDGNVQPKKVRAHPRRPMRERRELRAYREELRAREQTGT
jgi:hypothetical protein